MARPEGFLWADPGIPSLTVPYHDTNDFFFSGHVGTAALWFQEFWLNDYKCIAIAVSIVCLIEWIFLTVSRTHYFIDLAFGLMFAHMSYLTGEWISYILDVKICGWDGKVRRQVIHKPCHKCGWSNSDPSV